MYAIHTNAPIHFTVKTAIENVCWNAKIESHQAAELHQTSFFFNQHGEYCNDLKLLIWLILYFNNRNFVVSFFIHMLLVSSICSVQYDEASWCKTYSDKWRAISHIIMLMKLVVKSTLSLQYNLIQENSLWFNQQKAVLNILSIKNLLTGCWQCCTLQKMYQCFVGIVLWCIPICLHPHPVPNY